MENRRAQTLEALSTFIQAQKALLARTQEDIDGLARLKHVTITRPSFVSNVSEELSASSFKLSEQLDYFPGVPESVDWSVFSALDPTPLKTLAIASREDYSKRNKPSTKQHSELSELQIFVKRARITIIDPILALYSDPEESSEDEIDPEEVGRQIERQKIRELKKNKIKCGLTVPVRSNGVFIRRDMDDESMEVDISLDCERPASGSFESTPMDLDTAPAIRSTMPHARQHSVMKTTSAPSRSRRPSSKLQSLESENAAAVRQPKNGRQKTHIPKPKKESSPSPTLPPLNPPSTKPSKDKGKIKPETYKQAWSVSEQHLLERLLAEIPDGEKNRWQKISRAMDGRRTPRQVASRVQKYFEKLKRFGVSFEGGHIA